MTIPISAHLELRKAAAEALSSACRAGYTPSQAQHLANVAAGALQPVWGAPSGAPLTCAEHAALLACIHQAAFTRSPIASWLQDAFIRGRIVLAADGCGPEHDWQEEPDGTDDPEWEEEDGALTDETCGSWARYSNTSLFR
jgi:hypothetical protein